MAFLTSITQKSLSGNAALLGEGEFRLDGVGGRVVRQSDGAGPAQTNDSVNLWPKGEFFHKLIVIIIQAYTPQI